MTIVDEKRLKELAFKHIKKVSNKWKSITEIAWIFCFLAFMLSAASKAGNEFILLIGIALLIASISFTVFLYRNNVKIRNFICNNKTTYLYSVIKGEYIERTPQHSCDETTYTYDFKVNNKICTFDEIPLLGKKHPTDEFIIIKVVFASNDGIKKECVLAFNQKEYAVQLPKEKESENIFNLNNAFGLCTFVS